MLILFILHLTLPGINFQGDRVTYVDARSFALGNVSSVLTCGTNPAAYGLTRSISLEITPIIIQFNEQRGLRVYDSYGNNIGISTLTSNNNLILDIAQASLVLPFKSLRLGLDYRRQWDFNYYFQQEFRDDFYILTKTETQEYSGGIFSLSPCLTCSYKFFHIGFSADIFLGSTNYEFIAQNLYKPDSTFQTEENYQGQVFRLGFLIDPGRHFRLAYIYSPAYSIEQESASNNLDYPICHTLGVFYQPPSRILTRIMAEITRESWSEPILLYKLGVEHTIIERYALRYGFSVFPDYEQPCIWTTAMSLGFGIELGKAYIDLAYSYAKRDYSSDDYLDLGITNTLEFDETTLTFLLSAGFSF
jgi:hypothetical protein